LIKRFEWAYSNRLTRDISTNVKLAMTVFMRMQLAGAVTKEELLEKFWSYQAFTNEAEEVSINHFKLIFIFCLCRFLKTRKNFHKNANISTVVMLANLPLK
jgi:hypothetical protein